MRRPLRAGRDGRPLAAPPPTARGPPDAPADEREPDAHRQNRARAAAEIAISSPLLDDISVDGATGILINIVGGPDLKMKEIQEAASLVQEMAHEDANIIFGSVIDANIVDEVRITVIDPERHTAQTEDYDHPPTRALDRISYGSAGPPTPS